MQSAYRIKVTIEAKDLQPGDIIRRPGNFYSGPTETVESTKLIKRPDLHPRYEIYTRVETDHGRFDIRPDGEVLDVKHTPDA